MDPKTLGSKYDKIAGWWEKQHQDSNYGVKQFKRAVDYSKKSGKALDIGCGAGGRFINILSEHNFQITGIDVSKEMINLARKNHPNAKFFVQDICDYKTNEQFDFIVAWDSIFHLPLSQQKPVVTKICNLLAQGGTLIYTFGDANGEHDDTWHDDTFHYSSIGIDGNLEILAQNSVSCRHLEIDQWPAKHVYIIGIKG